MSVQQHGNDEETLDSNYDFLIKFMLLGDSGVGKTCFLHRYMEGEFRSRFTATVGVDFRLKKLLDLPGRSESAFIIRYWNQTLPQYTRLRKSTALIDGWGRPIYLVRAMRPARLAQGHWKTALGLSQTTVISRMMGKVKEYDFPEDDGADTKKKIHLQIWDTAGQERYRSLTKAFFRDGMGFLLIYDVGNLETFHSVRSWLSEIKEEAYCENPDIILIGNKRDLENRAVSEKQGKQLASDLKIPYMETSAATGENVTESINALLDLVMKRMRDYVSGIDSNQPATVSDTVTETKTSSSCSC